jgi:hypothetical protein
MPSTEFELHAWVDESMRTVNVPEPVYLLGAVITDPQECEGPREELRRILPSGLKLHWRDLDKRGKTQAAKVIATFDAAHLVVVASPLNIRKQERARAACMERLYWELGEMGVSRVYLESRTESLNKRDMQLVDRLHGRQALPRHLRVEIELPSLEPMLWVPDQVLGAMGDAETGDTQWLDALAGTVTRVDISL